MNISSGIRLVMLPRHSASAGWPGEGLRDAEPLGSDRPVSHHCRVGPVPSLSDQQAEVQRWPGHSVSRVRWTPGP